MGAKLSRQRVLKTRPSASKNLGLGNQILTGFAYQQAPQACQMHIQTTICINWRYTTNSFIRMPISTHIHIHCITPITPADRHNLNYKTKACTWQRCWYCGPSPEGRARSTLTWKGNERLFRVTIVTFTNFCRKKCAGLQRMCVHYTMIQ